MKKLSIFILLMFFVISISLASAPYYPPAIAINEQTKECGTFAGLSRAPQQYSIPDGWNFYVTQYNPDIQQDILETPYGYCEKKEVYQLTCCEKLGFSYVGEVGKLKQTTVITNYIFLTISFLAIVVPVYLGIPLGIVAIISFVLGKKWKDNVFEYHNKKGLTIGIILGIITSVILFVSLSIPYAMGSSNLSTDLFLFLSPILFYSVLGSFLGYLIKRFKS